MSTFEVEPALIDRVRSRLAANGRNAEPATVAETLRADGLVLGTASVLRIVEVLHSEMRGAGPLEPLLRTPGATDVLVNGHRQVFLDRGSGLEEVPAPFADEASVRRLAQRLASSAGRRLDDASPWVDAQLPDGTRLHAVLAPLARPGTVISLRIPARRAFDLHELEASGALSPTMRASLEELIRARISFVISGGTGTGKTTVLSALLALVARTERIVIAEDAAELKPDHPHVVGMEARPANVEGAGLITLRDLVRQALRMRPDRLVVGEVRGAEVTDLLAALNTGHQGGASTVHANTASAVPERFEALGVAAGLPRAAVHSQLCAGLEAVVHLQRDAQGRRRVAELAVLSRTPDGFARVVPALVSDGHSDREGPAFDAWRSLAQSPR